MQIGNDQHKEEWTVAVTRQKKNKIAQSADKPGDNDKSEREDPRANFG